MTTIKAYPFVEHADKKHVSQEIENEPVKFLKKALNTRFFTNNENITRYGVFKLMGWKYDMRPFLKKYLYKQYDSWHEIYALNKSNVRLLVGGRIIEIIEIKK